LSQPLKIGHVTDFHLFSDSNETLLGINTEESFQAVKSILQLSHQQLSFDLLLLTGDFSQDETFASYEKCVVHFSAFDCEKIAVIGNHDHAKHCEAAFKKAGIHMDFYLIKGNWLFVLFPTKISERIEGYIEESYFSDFITLISKYPTHHVLLATHHNIYPVEADWLQKYATQNAAVFMDFLKQFPQVKLVVSGHVHHESVHQADHISYYTTPSTCVQFDEKHPDFRLTHFPPGYRELLLYPDGHFETQVVRVKNYRLIPDPKADTQSV
jgi:3',5'-cyclic-AMP phosphodiesterase